MARQANNSRSGDDYVLPKFIQCDLTDKEKDYCRENLADWDKIAETIEDWAGDGYKLTISYDNRSECLSGFLTATDGQRTNKGYAISSRAPTVQGVITVLMFKHFEKLKGVWEANESSTKKSSWG